MDRSPNVAKAMDGRERPRLDSDRGSSLSHIHVLRDIGSS
jgi:hypothetical protein